MYVVTQHPPHPSLGQSHWVITVTSNLNQSSPPGMCSKQSTLHCPCPLTTGGLWSGAVCSEPVSLVGWGQNQVWYQICSYFHVLVPKKPLFGDLVPKVPWYQTQYQKSHFSTRIFRFWYYGTSFGKPGRKLTVT